MALLADLLSRRPVRFLISGGTAAATNLGLLFVLVHFFGLWYLLASVISYTTAIGVGFLLQKHFTFQDRRRGRRQSAWYAGFQILNLCLNTAGMYVSVTLLDVPYLLAQIGIGVALAISSYIVLKYALFASPAAAIRGLTCPACDGHEHGVWGRKSGYDLARCASCGLIFVYPLPPETAAIYDQAYFTGGKEFGYVDYDRDKEPMRRAFEAYLDYMETALGRKGRLLDVGCATGYFLELAIRRGWQAEGVEISAHASAVGRTRGLSIHTGTLESVALPEAQFDAVTLFDVLEHVRDPRVTVAQASRLLREGGLIVVSTPDTGSLWARALRARWHLVVPPEHLVLFDRRSLARLLGHEGFDPTVATNIGKRFTLPYIFQTLARWQELSLWGSLARLTNTSLLAKFSVPINLRDTFFMLAVKRRAP